MTSFPETRALQGSSFRHASRQYRTLHSSRGHKTGARIQSHQDVFLNFGSGRPPATFPEAAHRLMQPLSCSSHYFFVIAGLISCCQRFLHVMTKLRCLYSFLLHRVPVPDCHCVILHRGLVYSDCKWSTHLFQPAVASAN